MLQKLCSFFILLMITCISVLAQETRHDSLSARLMERRDTTTGKKLLRIVFGEYPRHRKGVYTTSGGDGPLFSFADIRNNGEHVRNIPRFTFFFNLGTNFNYDFNRHFGVFTGLNLRNIGMISKPNDSLKLKQRLYTLGVPLGFKIGDVTGGSFFFFAGAECDIALNYKEKQFIHGKKERKFNEWFSDRTPLLVPSLFAGFRFKPGFGLKVQYYFQNFFNEDYKEFDKGTNTTVYPYRNLDAKVVAFTFSYHFNTSRYFKVKKKKHYMRIEGKGGSMEVNY